MADTQIDRRQFLSRSATGAGVLALGLNGEARAGAAGSERPNILCLVSEDDSPQFIGAYGDPLARTPTIDRLASDGVVYDNCHAPAPVCAPTRFSIITGMHATSCGPAHHMRASGNIPDWLRGFPAYLRESGYYCTNNAKTDYNAPISIADTWDASNRQAHWRNRPSEAPFLAVFNHNVTHESSLFGSNEPLPDGVRPEDVRLPAYHPDLPELRADWALFYDQHTRLDRQLATRLDQLDADGLAEDTIVFYYGDHGGVLPRSKRYCYESGLRVPLIVRVPERWRHLWPAEPSSRVADAVSLLDLGPTMLSLAGLAVPDYMHGHAFAGIRASRPQKYVFGWRNRMDERYDMTRTVRDGRFRYIRNYLPHLIYGQHVEYMWQQAGVPAWQRDYDAGRLNEVQSAFWEEKPVEELYDLESDPDEVDNLADRRDYRPVAARMRRALERHMIRTRDNGFLPEGSRLEGIEQSSDRDAYPIARVIRIADVAVRRDPANVPRLVEWLADEIEPVRWWAALGCVMLRGRADGTNDALVARLDDSSPHVRVAAAEALCWLGDTDAGFPVLEDMTLNHASAPVRLQAINALDNLGAIVLPAAHGVFEQALQDMNNDVVKVANYALNKGSDPEVQR